MRTNYGIMAESMENMDETYVGEENKDTDNSDDASESSKDAKLSRATSDEGGPETENESVSSDDITWTPSIGSDEDEEEEEDDPSQWKETPMKLSDFRILFNRIDEELEARYVQEVNEIRKRLLRESMSRMNIKNPSLTALTANELLNTYLPATVIMELMMIMNHNLSERRKNVIELREFAQFLRSFFWLCYYSCSLCEIKKHEDAYPCALKEIKNWRGKLLAKRYLE